MGEDKDLIPVLRRGYYYFPRSGEADGNIDLQPVSFHADSGNLLKVLTRDVAYFT